MAGAEAVNMLKLRASYGRTGNIYQGATSYMTATTGTTNRFNRLPKATIDSPGNPNLSWERTSTFNVGMDFSLFDRSVRGAVDWYNKKSDKVFASKSLESTTGFTNLVMNFADVKNNGLEMTLAYDWVRPRSRDGFGWTTSATAAWNRNEVTHVEIQARQASQVIDLGYKQGYPVSSMFSYVFAGLDADGVQTWKAADGREVMAAELHTISPESVVFSGQAEPKHTYAMENHFTWRGFSLNVMMVYYGGHKMRALPVTAMVGNPTVAPLASYYLDAWTPENTNTVVPGIGQYNKTSAASAQVRNSDIFIQPADFLKIRNIVFGYDVPKDIISRVGLSNLSLRFQIDNLAPLWMKNDLGVDPETLGVRRPTSYVFGLNFRF